MGIQLIMKQEHVLRWIVRVTIMDQRKILVRNGGLMSVNTVSVTTEAPTVPRITESDLKVKTVTTSVCVTKKAGKCAQTQQRQNVKTFEKTVTMQPMS